MSLNPAVASMPVTAPVRSITALVTSVVPCTTSLISAMATPSRFSSASMPSVTASEGSCGVVSRLCTDIFAPRASNRAKSVNVPPMSTPMRYTRPAPPAAHPFGARMPSIAWRQSFTWLFRREDRPSHLTGSPRELDAEDKPRYDGGMRSLTHP